MIAVGEQSVSHLSPASPLVRIRRIHLAILLCLLAIGAFFRFCRIDRQALWLDEYWTVYLSTGRGQTGSSLFDAPLGVLFDPPPPVGFSDAPSWPHIWTGLDSAIHPPLYFIVLRWWVDVFGDSDAAMRSLSAILDLAAVLVLFDCILRTAGPWTALLASALMLFSVAQLDQSREVRSYALEALLGVLCCRAVIQIEHRGVTWPRSALLCLGAAAMSLTHYFAVGTLAGLGAYALLRLRRRARIATLGLIFAGVLLVAISWGPFISSEGFHRAPPDYPASATSAQIAIYALLTPTRLILSLTHISWLGIFPLAVLVFVMPLVHFRRPGSELLWWLWLMGGVGLLLAFDLARQTRMISITKYLVPVAPAVYALVALNLLHKRGIDGLSATINISLIVGALATLGELMPAAHVQWLQWFPVLAATLMVFALISAVGLRHKSWSTWVVGAIGLVWTMNEAMLGARSHVYLVYLAMAGTWIFLVATAPARHPCAWLGPTAGVALAVWALIVAAEFTAGGSQIIVKGDWREVADALTRRAAPSDILAFAKSPDLDPPYCYIVLRHYAPGWKQPVIFLGGDGLNRSTREELSIRCRAGLGRGCVWMVGIDPDGDTQRFFPGWHRGPAAVFPQICDLWPVYPPA